MESKNLKLLLQFWQLLETSWRVQQDSYVTYPELVKQTNHFTAFI